MTKKLRDALSIQFSVSSWLVFPLADEFPLFATSMAEVFGKSHAPVN
jgi:hypothetical protein